MKRILKMIISLPVKILNKIIDEESQRVNEFNRCVFDTALNEGCES